MQLNKKGNASIIFLTILIVVVFILMFFSYMVYTQINVMIYPIKQNMFYIVQNSYFSLDKEKFQLYDYIVDENELKNKIVQLSMLNYKDSVIINDIYYDKYENVVKINYSILLEPIVFKSVLGNIIKFYIKDNIKLKSMEVK